MQISANRANFFRILIFTAYLALNLLLLARHEMWRDEMNVWLFARDVPLSDFFSQLRYQGHPCLWYLLILPFARLGFPCRIMGVISLTIMGVTAAVYLWKAPMADWMKGLTLFFPLFTYYYPVISRAYCLVALLIVLLAYLYHRRNDKPMLYGFLLGLLVQADTIGIPVAGMISAMWVTEGLWKSYHSRSIKAVMVTAKGAWIPLISVILWFLQFYDMGESDLYLPKDMGVFELLRESKNYAYHMLDRLTYLQSDWAVVLFWICIAAVILLCIGLGTVWPFLVMAASVAFQAVLSTLLYQLRVYHFLMVFFAYIWMLWIYAEKLEHVKPIAKERQKKAGKMGFAILRMLFVSILLLTFFRWTTEEQYMGFKNARDKRMSDGQYAADYLRENSSPEELIIISGVPYVASIQGYLPEYSFYFAGSGKVVSYADWTREQSQSITYEALTHWIRSQFPEKESFLYVQSAEDRVEGEEDALGRGVLLYKTLIPTVMDEDYRIYRLYL